MTYRPLTTLEEKLISRILSVLADKSISFRSRSVKTIDSEGSIKFDEVSGGALQRALPVEAQFQDLDGVYVHALLFVIGDSIDELEFYKGDGSEICKMPDAEHWEILDLRPKHTTIPNSRNS
jgi:hypothetical protein